MDKARCGTFPVCHGVTLQNQHATVGCPEGPGVQGASWSGVVSSYC